MESAGGHAILWTLFFLGWAIVLVGTFLINHFDLFGLRQVYLYHRRQEYTELGFRTPFLYRLVRHPSLRRLPEARLDAAADTEKEIGCFK